MRLIRLNTFRFFGKYGWAWYKGAGRWGNTGKHAWLAKILHKINGDKPFRIEI